MVDDVRNVLIKAVLVDVVDVLIEVRNSQVELVRNHGSSFQNVDEQMSNRELKRESAHHVVVSDDHKHYADVDVCEGVAKDGQDDVDHVAYFV